MRWDGGIMKHRFPSIGLLNTFEIAARHLSFTVASQDLCLTQGAISRQIKALEDQIGITLFLRKHRSIELTPEGVELYKVVTRSLDDIGSCLEALRDSTAFPQITVAASVSFAYYWLMPKLEEFSEAHPEIDLRILASDQKVDLRRDGVDVAILFGHGSWDGVDATSLFGETVYPVCSPAYLAAHPELRHPSDILDQTLVHLDGGGTIWGSVDWQAWLAMQGITTMPVRRGIQLNSYPMVLHAVEAGRGVALGWSYIVDEMLQDGRLVCPINASLDTRNGYYLGASKDKQHNKSVETFKRWIVDAARI